MYENKRPWQHSHEGGRSDNHMTRNKVTGHTVNTDEKACYCFPQSRSRRRRIQVTEKVPVEFS